MASYRSVHPHAHSHTSNHHTQNPNNVLVWELNDISVSGVRKYPFQNGDVTGESTRNIAGGVFTVSPDSTPILVGINDNDGRFNDGDTSQVLANNETINGYFETAGNRFTPEVAYSVRSLETGEVNTIYSVELGANTMVGIVSDAPLIPNTQYEFIARVSTHPTVDYSQLADTFLEPVVVPDPIDVLPPAPVTQGEIGLDASEPGQFKMFVWELSDISLAGVRANPFRDGDVTGESTSRVAGGTFTIGAGSSPITVGVNDNDGLFDDGDTSQVLANNETIDDFFEVAGRRLTPEVAYSVRNVATGEVITIYSVELGGNNMVGLVSDAPLQSGAQYEFIARVDTHPEVSYSQLADTYIGDVVVDNQGPVAVDDVITGGELDSQLIISPADLLGNDYDPDGDALQGVGLGNAVNGTVVYDGTNVVFTPTDGFVGNASFTYTITDGNGANDTATVNLVIAGIDPNLATLANDTLTGDVGADTFVWTLDTVVDNGYNTDVIVNGGAEDSIDISDLLEGASTTAESLDAYLDISYSDHIAGTSGTVIDIDVGANGDVNQQIVIEGFDLTAGGTLGDVAMINQLLDNNNLIVD